MGATCALGALLVGLHAVDREDDVIGGQRIAVVTLQIAPQMKDPGGGIGDLPALHQHALVGCRLVVVRDQAAINLAPDARHEGRAVGDRIVAVDVVGDADDDLGPRLCGSGRRHAADQKHRGNHRTKAEAKLLECALNDAPDCNQPMPDPERLSRGSRMSRSPSPSRLIPSTVKKMHRAGEQGQPPGRADIGPPVSQHAAPGRNLGRHAEAKEAQRCLRDNGGRHGEGADHHRRWDQVRHDVAHDDARVIGAEGPCRVDEFARPQRQRLSPRYAAVGNPSLADEREDQVFEPLTEECHDGDRQQQWRERPHDFHELLNQKIGDAGKIAGDGPESYANDTGDDHDHDRDHQ